VTDFEWSLALGGVAPVAFGTRCCCELFRGAGRHSGC
jgi:hypothetical protein